MPYIWEVSTKNNNYDQKKRQKGNFSMKHYTRTYWYLARKYEKQTKMEKYFASKYDRLLEY